MNNEIIPVQNVESTNNPQVSQGTPAASDASQFQKSAGTDVLSQNHSIQVESTGQPIESNTTARSSSAWVIVIIVTASIISLLVTSYMYRRRAKRSAGMASEQVKETVESSSNVTKPAKKTSPKGKKKPSRSKRRR